MRAYINEQASLDLQLKLVKRSEKAGADRMFANVSPGKEKADGSS